MKAKVDSSNQAIHSNILTSEDCQLLKDFYQISAKSIIKSNFFYAFHANSNRNQTSWIVDTGASQHMTGDLSLFSEIFYCENNHTHYTKWGVMCCQKNWQHNNLSKYNFI